MKNINNKFKIGILIAIGIFLVGTYGVITFANSNPDEVEGEQTQDIKKVDANYESQIDENGTVVVEAIPIVLSSSENNLFNITFTTHAVDLNYEIESIAKLIDDKGNSYDSILWTGGKGGHHLSGELSFPPLSNETKSITLIIPQIDSIDREFEWDLN